MFNHSRNPNVGYMRDMKRGFIRYSTLREVRGMSVVETVVDGCCRYSRERN